MLWPWLAVLWLALAITVPIIGGAKRKLAAWAYFFTAPVAVYLVAHLVIGASNWASLDLGEGCFPPA